MFRASDENDSLNDSISSLNSKENFICQFVPFNGLDLRMTKSF